MTAILVWIQEAGMVRVARALVVCAAAMLFAGVYPTSGWAVVNGASTRVPEQMESGLSPFAAGSPLTKANFQAADTLHAALAKRINRNSPMLVASLVELNDFDRSSTFGRLVSQQVGSRLGQYGYTVLDVRLGSDLVARRQKGEFMLTRETARMLETRYAAQAVLLGNYVVARNEVFVSLRVLRLDDRSIVAAHEYSLMNSGVVRTLLADPGDGDTGSSWADFALRRRVFSSD